MNPYLYVGGDPMRSIDPLGLGTSGYTWNGASCYRDSDGKIVSTSICIDAGINAFFFGAGDRPGFATVVGYESIVILPLKSLSAAAKVARAAEAVADGVETLNASAIRFSQTSVNDLGEIVDSMSANGWKGGPITVVEMADGELTTANNTRLLAASLTDTPVQAIVVDYNAAIEESTAIDYASKSGEIPKTWGEAILNRIGRQSGLYRNTYPNGSPFTSIGSW